MMTEVRDFVARLQHQLHRGGPKRWRKTTETEAESKSCSGERGRAERSARNKKVHCPPVGRTTRVRPSSANLFFFLVSMLGEWCPISGGKLFDGADWIRAIQPLGAKAHRVRNPAPGYWIGAFRSESASRYDGRASDVTDSDDDPSR